MSSSSSSLRSALKNLNMNKDVHLREGETGNIARIDRPDLKDTLAKENKTPVELKFERQKHIRFFLHSLRSLPSAYGSLDTNRLLLVHYAVHSLDLLGFLDECDQNNTLHLDKEAIIKWIYSLLAQDNSGFKGGTYLGPLSKDQQISSTQHIKTDNYQYDHSHIAMTYTALCTLAALGDDLSKINDSSVRQSIIQHLPSLQKSGKSNTEENVAPYTEGSFHCLPTQIGSEHDMRFLYCACSISYMLNDWSGINKSEALQYIQRCHSYDGAFALLPGQEGHGGSTFCAVASLFLMGELHLLDSTCGNFITVNQKKHQNGQSTWKDQLILWCVNRQLDRSGGMQGRPNKYEDTCYSYWIGGTLQILDCQHLIQSSTLTNYVLENQTELGGFSKVWGAAPDLLHSFYSMAWLSMYHHNQNHNQNHDQIEKTHKKISITEGANHHRHVCITDCNQHNCHDNDKDIDITMKRNVQNHDNANEEKKTFNEHYCFSLNEFDCVLGIRKCRSDYIKDSFTNDLKDT